MPACPNLTHPSPAYPPLPQKIKDLALDKIWCLTKIKRLGQLLLLQVPPHPSPAYPNQAYPSLPNLALPQMTKVLALALEKI